jgi:hypothetical protein
MNDSISRQQSSYSKGLVLGFTMAEIMVLVIFSLLLVLSFILLDKDKKIKKLTKIVEAKAAEVHSLEQRLSLILDSYSKSRNEFEDLFRELALAKERKNDINVLRKAILSLSEKSSKLQKTKDILEKFNLPCNDLDELEKALEKGVKSTSIVEKMREQLDGLTDNEQIEGTLERILAERRSLESSVTNLNRKVKKISEKLQKLGHGTEMPACWVSAETGKPEYIFDIALTSTGFLIVDRKIEGREEDKLNLPLDKIEFGTEINSSKFLKEFGPIYEWSKRNGCRFFVRVFDLTKADEKSIYKKETRVLEQRFYKYEVLDESFPMKGESKLQN